MIQRESDRRESDRIALPKVHIQKPSWEYGEEPHAAWTTGENVLGHILFLLSLQVRIGQRSEGGNSQRGKITTTTKMEEVRSGMPNWG